ncbi:MAG: arylsulfatase [Planctomycetota bacterium]
MDRRNFLKSIGLSAVSAAIGGCLVSNQNASTPGENNKPNIILIMADDMGFSDIGCYGSEIQTPNLDSLASGGIRFKQFYNTARCCPTRASLLTGLYQHQAGMGQMTDRRGDVKPPGPYQGYLNQNCVTIAEVLKTAGYRTLMSGKWHVGEDRPHWPLDRGFDRYYGLISGAANYFDISKGQSSDSARRFAIDNEAHLPPKENYYITDAFTENAVSFLDQYSAEDKPFFMYVAYTAPHWPLHALPEDIAKYKGKYIKGWDNLRQERHKRMIKMGLVDKKWPLSPRDDGAVAWEDVEDKELMDLKMAVYAAQIDRMDQGIGKIIDKLREIGKEKNTLVLFLADNGGCHEYGPLGFDKRNNGLPPGGVDSFMSYGQSWANASNTPFRMFKKWVHEGGIATPLIANWPAVIKKRDSLTDQPGHVIDIMATCCDIGGAKYPRIYKGKPITALQGKSLLPIFKGKQRKPHDYIFWEHRGNCAVRQGKWKLVAESNGKWELYDMEKDRTEMNNLIEKYPEKANELMARYKEWAANTGAKPGPKKI